VDHHNLCPGCMEEIGAAKTCPHCGLPAGAGPESALHLPPGTILQDKYLLGRALGQGGFGITYLAWDLNLNLKLAIKEYLPLDMASRATGQPTISIYKKELSGSFQYGLEKYLEEARTLARFAGHPSIVWVRDFFKANGTAYIVMEYVEGVTLKDYLQDKQEPLPLEQALTIFMPVLDALKEVHTEGILHRDISPDNLLISKRGRIVLIDFGAARQAVGEQSRSLSVIMKPGFSPEEQYHSRGKQGPWTDIYSVGATMYRTLTGITPPESLSRLSDDTLVAPSQLGIKIDSPLEKIILKALSVSPKKRYQKVEEFRSALLAVSAKDYKEPLTVQKEVINFEKGKDVKENAAPAAAGKEVVQPQKESREVLKAKTDAGEDRQEKILTGESNKWLPDPPIKKPFNKRLAIGAAALLCLALIIFGISRLFPGPADQAQADPEQAAAEEQLMAEQVAEEEPPEQEQVADTEPEEDQLPDELENEPEIEPEPDQLEEADEVPATEAPVEVETTAAVEAQPNSTSELPVLCFSEKEHGGWIYYRTINGFIKKRKVGGNLSENSSITLINGESFGVSGDWLYYINNNYYSLVRMRNDGSSSARIVGPWEDYYKRDGDRYIPK